jgi:hypothetical protein
MRGGNILMSSRLNRMKGLFFVLDRENEQGLTHWGEELKKRGIPGVILFDEYTVNNHRYLYAMSREPKPRIPPEEETDFPFHLRYFLRVEPDKVKDG